MLYNVYTARDLVADDTIGLFYSLTDGQAIRDHLPPLSRVRPVQDLRFYRIGCYDSVSMRLEHIEPVAVDMDAYKFPEQKTEAKPSVDNVDEVKKSVDSDKSGYVV